MAALIANWRSEWGQGNFPFIYVQLANYGKFRDTIPGKGGGTTQVRERQLNNLSIAGTGMVVAIDNADDPEDELAGTACSEERPEGQRTCTFRGGFVSG